MQPTLVPRAADLIGMFKESAPFTRIIDEARGFLNALRFLGEPNVTLWINGFPLRGDIEASIEWYISEISKDFPCQSKSTISGQELKKVIRGKIFDKLVLVRDRSVVRELEWQLYEYYGLASTSVDINNEFSPLSSEGSYMIELSSNEYIIHACIITPVANHIVVLTIGEVKT